VGVFRLVDMRLLASLFLLPLSALATPRESRAHASSNGVWSIQFVESAPEQCRVEATRDTDPAWTLDRCVGTVEDLFFISDDGLRFWVLRVLPRTPAMPKQKGSKSKSPPPGTPFIYAQVAALFDKQGNVLAERTLKDFLQRRFDKLRDLDSHFCWLEGEFGVPGRRPRITEANQVEFETVEPKTFRLDF
jgi:hypothetical protein